jgi:hypothetical protein
MLSHITRQHYLAWQANPGLAEIEQHLQSFIYSHYLAKGVTFFKRAV